jgi:hypothetical protein
MFKVIKPANQTLICAALGLLLLGDRKFFDGRLRFKRHADVK